MSSSTIPLADRARRPVPIRPFRPGPESVTMRIDGWSSRVPRESHARNEVAGASRTVAIRMTQATTMEDGNVLAVDSPHALDPETVAGRLRVDPRVGLSAAEARRRAILGGPNALDVSTREPVWKMLVDAATEPFVLLLAVAGGLAIVVGEVRDGLLVLAGLLPIVGADVATEYRGERALEALREASAPLARVRRDGAAGTVPASELVTGDVVLLQAGDVVPADVRISRSDRLLVDRSVL